jgi:VacB/RNase II family 3'-5' exoribonuclease
VGHAAFDLASSAREEMIQNGFNPDFEPGTSEELARIRQQPLPQNGLRDLRNLLWSSIDNDTSRDLDQIEVAERTPDGIRVLVAIADVDSAVCIGSAIDAHASSQTTTVYTPVRTFPMLPVELSTDLTSLNEAEDRAVVVIELLVAPDGSLANSDIFRALVCNKAQLTYSHIGPWLEGTGAADSKVAASAELQAQLKLQDEAATLLRQQRYRLGALQFDRIEASPVVSNGEVRDIAINRKNRASELIEDFMIAANTVMAQTLANANVSSIRRVVKAPERWNRIVELATRYGAHLPEQPDVLALNSFLQKQKQADPAHYPDLSLSIIKLLGPGQYVVAHPGEENDGHFSLAVHDYTHSTAPNRRFADLVIQRLIKAAEQKQAAPYSDDELAAIAQNCNVKESAARKVERTMAKRAAAVAFQNRIGEIFEAIVTGVTPKGVFVRVPVPPLEGRLMQGETGVDVGDHLRVKLLNTDPQRGFIDFGRVGSS